MAAAHAQQLTRATVAGEVDHPGGMTFTGAPRLADAAKSAQVHGDAYFLGASLLRSEFQPQQARLKAGLLFDLNIIERLSASRDRDQASALAHRVRAWIESMPVTGRLLVRTLEPHALQVSAADNLPLREGDRLVYPARPGTVRVVGAVEHDCELPHAGLREARLYADQCPTSAFADPDLAYVIEPDGSVVLIGIALWNRSPPMPVAPGAVIYLPFGRKAIEGLSDPGFNREMADFIATQPLGGTGGSP